MCMPTLSGLRIQGSQDTFFASSRSSNDVPQTELQKAKAGARSKPVRSKQKLFEFLNLSVRKPQNTWKDCGHE